MAGDPSDVSVNRAVAKERLKCLHQWCVRPLGLPSVREAAELSLPRHVVEDHADGPEFPEVVGAGPHPDRELPTT